MPSAITWSWRFSPTGTSATTGIWRQSYGFGYFVTCLLLLVVVAVVATVVVVVVVVVFVVVYFSDMFHLIQYRNIHAVIGIQPN